MPKPLYETLGASESDDAETIKRHYRRKAKECHPDKGGDVEAFKAATQAVAVLTDPAKRAHYDQTEGILLPQVNTIRAEITPLARERARQTAEMVRLRLETGEHAAAIAAIVKHREESTGRDSGEMTLAETGLAVRTVNILEKAGIFTLAQLREAPRTRWRYLPHMGPATIEVLERLIASGLER